MTTTQPQSCACSKGTSCFRIPMLFTDHIQTTLNQIKNETHWKVEIEGFVREAYWNKQSSLIALLHQEINKLSVTYSKPPYPKCEDAEKLFEGATKCVLALVSSIYHLPLQQGQSLFQKWRQFYISLLTGLLTYSKSIWGSHEHTIAQSTGVIWELCSTAESLPKDNKHCLVEKEKQVSNLVEDALSELEETKKTYADGTSEEDSVSEHDVIMLTAGIGLVKTAKILVVKVTKATQMNGKCDTEQQVADTDTLTNILDKTSEVVDDFAASLYPPTEALEIKQNMGPLVEHLNTLLTEFRDTHLCAENDSQWTSMLENAISHNNNKVSGLVS